MVNYTNTNQNWPNSAPGAEMRLPWSNRGTDWGELFQLTWSLSFAARQESFGFSIQTANSFVTNYIAGDERFVSVGGQNIIYDAGRQNSSPVGLCATNVHSDLNMIWPGFING